VAYGIRLQSPLPDAADAVISVVWILGITNAFNLLDNIDGLAAGTAAVAATTFFLIALFNDQDYSALLAIGLAGAMLGFLRSNFHPATIYMGDAGSLFIGFLMAYLGLKMRTTVSEIPQLFAPLVVLGVAVLHDGRRFAPTSWGKPVHWRARPPQSPPASTWALRSSFGKHLVAGISGARWVGRRTLRCTRHRGLLVACRSRTVWRHGHGLAHHQGCARDSDRDRDVKHLSAAARRRLSGSRLVRRASAHSSESVALIAVGNTRRC
jgi:hypothetical protein